MKTRIVLGGPGAGKTTRLLEIVEDCLNRGLDPNRLAFVSYTKAAVAEAVARTEKKFGLEQDYFPWFRTLHSIGYQKLGVRQGGLADADALAAFGQIVGYDFSDRRAEEQSLFAGTEDDGTAFLGIIGYARAREISLRSAWEKAGGEVDWYVLEWMDDAYRRFKASRALVDFDDTISGSRGALPIDVAIVDEAQDLSTAQWSMLDRLLAGVEELYVAGDDDQAVYEWSGADVDRFIDLEGEVETLPISHRLPNEVFDYAAEIAGQIRHRRPREWSSAGHSGAVEWIADASSVDLSSGTWMLLARNVALLSDFCEECEVQGVAYATRSGSSIRRKEFEAIAAYEALRDGKIVSGERAKRALGYLTTKRIRLDDEAFYCAEDLGLESAKIWHEALWRIPLRRRLYYVEILRRREKLNAPPRVYVGTIHSVKGREAENIVLRPDMVSRTFRGYEEDPDPEHRTFYVGATRARQNLYLMTPETPWAYDL